MLRTCYHLEDRFTGHTTLAQSLPGELLHRLEETRQSYLTQMRKYSGVSSSWGTEYYRRRLGRAEGGVALGELAPFLLQQIFDVKNEALTRVLPAWLPLYHHALMLDDFWDGDLIEERARVSVVASTLLKESMESWARVGLNTSGDWMYFRQVYREHMSSGQRSPASVEALGKRSALVKVLANALCSIGKGRSLEPAEERGIELLAAGFQLLDDVADVEQDWAFARQSVLIERALSWLSETPISLSRVKDLPREMIWTIVMVSGAFTEICMDAAHFFRRGEERLGVGRHTTLAALIRDIVQALNRRSLAIRTILVEESSGVLKVRSGMRDALEVLATGEMHDPSLLLPSTSAAEVWHRLRREGDCVPRASN